MGLGFLFCLFVFSVSFVLTQKGCTQMYLGTGRQEDFVEFKRKIQDPGMKMHCCALHPGK